VIRHAFAAVPWSAVREPAHGPGATRRLVTLAASAAHVWRVPVAPAPDPLPALERVLSAEERSRVARAKHNGYRTRFVYVRAVLRFLLGHYLGSDAAAIDIDYGAHGKPRLAGAHAASGLRFNVSHSGDQALFAFARGRSVGVDVERHSRRAAMEAIARRYFAPAEAARIAACDGERRLRAFYACWARKEAVIKACGRGLSMALDGFEVGVDPDVPPRLVCIAAGLAELGDLALVDLPTRPGASAALAVKEPFTELAGFDLEPPGVPPAASVIG